MLQNYERDPKDFENETLTVRRAIGEAQGLLRDAARQLGDTLQEEHFMADTPLGVSTAMEIAAERIGAALRVLESVAPVKRAATTPCAPTRQQGQFLAFIREYMMRNHAGVAPTHAALQQFFNLTPPSVNSMLIRLESRGFIRRIPHQARGIELTIDPDLILPLEWSLQVQGVIVGAERPRICHY